MLRLKVFNAFVVPMIRGFGVEDETPPVSEAGFSGLKDFQDYIPSLRENSPAMITELYFNHPSAVLQGLPAPPRHASPQSLQCFRGPYEMNLRCQFLGPRLQLYPL